MLLTEETSENRDNDAALYAALARELQTVLSAQNCTKRTAVRLAISNSIQNDVLRPGEYLPSEIALAEILNVSLGTVQVALGQLQDLGVIQRRRGDGTRVSDAEPFTDNVWHFRFLSRENNIPLRMAKSKLKMSKITKTGYWSEFLGKDKEYFCISRRVRMQDGTRAGAEMYLPGGLASGLGEVDVDELELINIRPFLETHLNLKITGCTNRVSVITPGEAEVRRLGLTSQQPHYEINATAFTDNKRPVYHQRILVSVSDCNLEF